MSIVTGAGGLRGDTREGFLSHCSGIALTRTLSASFSLCGRFLQILALFGVLSLPALADSCIWYADDDSIRQVQTSVNQVTRVIALRNPHRLVMNAADCGVWTLDKHDRKLLRYNAEGVLEREIRVRDLNPRLDEIDRLHVDPSDDSVWITDDRRIYHLTSAGQRIHNFSAPGEIRRLRVALDRSLWVLGKRDLWHFDAQGTLLATYTLGRHLAGDARYFEVDSLGGVIWLADNNDLAQLKLANPVDPPLRIRLQRNITGFTLDPLKGNVWVAQQEALLAYSRAGALMHAVDLESRNLRKPEKLAFDPVSRSLWAGTERAVSRYTDTGEFVISFPAKDGDEALGVPVFKVEPTLTLVRPPRDALSNNPRPLFTLSYGAACNSVVCTFSNEYLASYQLTATLNSLAVSPQFVFDASTGQSNFTPATRLPEGTNTFSAQVKNSFGLQSNTVTNAFSIDTIAPQFLAVIPADGTIVQIPQAVIQGGIDDPLAAVVLESSGLTQTGASFSFPVTLQPGANIFVISAIDRAGNRSTVQRTLVLASLTLSITSPAAGTSIAGSTVLVSGTLQGPANTGVTVNGVVAVVEGGRFYATVPLQPGPNTLTVAAQALDGASTQQSLNVTSTGPAAVEVSADAVSGVAPLKVKFTVNTALTVQRIEADFDGNGTIDFTTTNPTAPIEFTYTQPGRYAARLVITSAGIPTTQTVQIVVQDPVVLDQQLRALWQGFAGALVARDKAKAMQFLNKQAQEKYGTVFDTLISDIPQILGSFSNLQTVTVSGEIGEYAINRTIDGVNRIFFIYMLRDVDGVWRIDAM